MDFFIPPRIGTRINYRPGTPADSFSVFSVFEQALADLTRRFGAARSAEPRNLEQMWDERRSLYEHLARTADQYWVAEREERMIGFVRSILRDGVRQLTELFVLPGEQSDGIGRELMERAFPTGEKSRYRSILATADARAQALYLKAGVYPRFPLYYFSKPPEVVEADSDLQFLEINPGSEYLRAIARIDRQLLGFSRDIDHEWLISQRHGFICLRDGKPVGYGYAGVRNGPFAVLDKLDISTVLSHAETLSAVCERSEFGLEVPMVNQVAVDYLLGRGFKLDTFIAILMNDHPTAKFENYIVTSPPFIL